MLNKEWVSILLVISAHALVYPQAQSPILRGPLGNVCVAVNAFSANGNHKTLRMVLDTGSSVTMLDNAVPEDYWEKIGTYANLQERAKIVKVENIKINSLVIFDKKYNNINAIRTDLSGYSRFDDSPIDGVIGMDILNKISFGLDLAHESILYEKPNTIGLNCNLSFSGLGVPEVILDLNGKQIKARVDTGSNSFLILSQKDGEKINKKDSNEIGVEQGVSSMSMLKIGSVSESVVSIGDAKWETSDVIVGNGANSLLGVNSMWPWVWFDFPSKTMTFFVDTLKRLHAEPPVKIPIHVYWDRTINPALLRVFAVKPNSVYEKSGLIAGDVILSINGSVGKGVTISNFKKCILGEKPVELVIQRDGEKYKICLPSYLKSG